MAMQLAGRARGRGRSRTYRPNSEINVTPFVDVMLVLLIVFMVTAPLMTVGVAVDLPKAHAPALQTDKEPLYVSVKPDGRVFVQETPVDLAGIIPVLTGITNSNLEARILVRGDRANNYGRMLEVMAAISHGGFKKIGLVAEMPNTPPPKATPGKPGARPGAGQR